MTEQTVNLIDDRDLTARLIAEPLEWRVRAVEELTVDSATSCTRRRSLQVAPLRPLLHDFVSTTDTHALIALNVAAMPRGPLLDFDIRGPLGDAWLLPRTEIATRQKEYLVGVAATCGEAISPGLQELLAAILGFTGELLSEDVPADLITDYVVPGLGQSVNDETHSHWREIAWRTQSVLRPRLDEFRKYSAPENPVLVIPELFQAGVVASDEEATGLLEQYCGLLEHLDETSRTSESPGPEDEFLNSLADYANSYDLIAAMKVPLDEPFLVKFSERRDVAFSLLRNAGHQDLVVADARSNHVTFRVEDPSVRITAFEAYKPGLHELAYGAFQSRQDQQSRAFYAHDADRDYRLQLTFQLALLRRLQLVPYIVTTLLLALTGGLWVSVPTDLGTLALVVGPSALAASVLLYRDPSTLGSRLRCLSSVVLIIALLAVLVSATLLYLLGPNVLGLL